MANLINWSANLETGVKAIDSDHKKLVDMINALNEAMSQGKGKDILATLLKALANYCLVHFAMEEKLMATHGYPESVQHMAQHEGLRTQVAELLAKQAAGALVITIPVMTFLKNWLSGHIVGTDKKFGAFLSAKGIK